MIHDGLSPKPRLRDLGISIGRLETGPLNAITDVPGVRVGQTTVIEGQRIRTGVTVVHPHEGFAFREPVPAAIVVLNGAGEMTGRSQVDEYGILETPIAITNTLAVGAVHRAMVEWLCREAPDLGTDDFVIPVVAETFDGFLNDGSRQAIGREHVLAALDGATGGPVAEGAVGGGTGMLTFQFKGGIGTSSRLVTIGTRRYTVGVLVQSNFGRREDMLIDGVRVGLEIGDLMPEPGGAAEPKKDGSIIVVVATDAPFSERQLRRLGTRAMLGIGSTGGLGRHSSGDIIIAFSNATANRLHRDSRQNGVPEEDEVLRREQLNDKLIDSFFQAVVEATGESIVNAMVAAPSVTGRNGNRVHALPHDRLTEIMRRYGRIG
jgi:D-aminopeptidase